MRIGTIKIKVDSLNRILDDLYEKIEDAQTRLDEVDQEIAMVEKSAMTKKSIFEMLEGFSKYYDVMSPEDKKALLQAMVSFIELYPEKRDDKHLIKTIELDLTSAESKATYEEIKAYVAEHNDGMKVSNLYIAQVKAKYGIIERENYNKPKSDDARQPKCPKEKEEAIVEALKAFKMI